MKYGWRLEIISPEWDHQIDVKSMTTPGLIYSLNLHNVSCTCPDFLHRRQSHRQDSPARLCKHLLFTMLRMQKEVGLSDHAISALEYLMRDRLERAEKAKKNAAGK